MVLTSAIIIGAVAAGVLVARNVKVVANDRSRKTKQVNILNQMQTDGAAVTQKNIAKFNKAGEKLLGLPRFKGLIKKKIDLTSLCFNAYSYGTMREGSTNKGNSDVVVINRLKSAHRMTRKYAMIKNYLNAKKKNKTKNPNLSIHILIEKAKLGILKRSKSARSNIKLFNGNAFPLVYSNGTTQLVDPRTCFNGPSSARAKDFADWRKAYLQLHYNMTGESKISNTFGSNVFRIVVKGKTADLDKVYFVSDPDENVLSLGKYLLSKTISEMVRSGQIDGSNGFVVSQFSFSEKTKQPNYTHLSSATSTRSHLVEFSTIDEFDNNIVKNAEIEKNNLRVNGRSFATGLPTISVNPVVAAEIVKESADM